MKIKSVRKTAAIATSAVLVASAALSAQSADAALVFGNGDCTPVDCTLDFINMNGGLEIGNLLFRDFNAELTGANVNPGSFGLFPATNVNAGVSLAPQIDATNGPGFQLSFPLNPTPGIFLDIQLDYIVEALNSASIDSVTAEIGNANVTGAATVGLLEDVYTGGFGGTKIADLNVGLPGLPTEETGDFAAETLIYVTKDISASSPPLDADGNQTGAALFSSIYNFHGEGVGGNGGDGGTEVPTPALLPGLLGFGATLLRKRKQAAAIA